MAGEKTEQPTQQKLDDSRKKGQVARTGGAGLTVAPCQTDDDWFYPFYHLPADMPGGGPELLLQFDDKGTCVGARWMSTQ